MRFLLILLPVQIFGIVLMFPSVDIENPPIAVFEDFDGESTEVTVVFSDEDHPNPLIDIVYDIYRLFRYGRVVDIETFVIKKDTVLFPDDFASVSSFHQTENLHTRAEIPIDEFELFDGELVVYVNTWNHMFSNKPLRGLTYIPVILKPERGGREDAERIYSLFKK